MTKLHSLVCCVVALAACGSVGAVELRFRQTANVADSIVTLGHVAEIRGAEGREALSLAAVQLFPTPIEGSNAYVEEILETLELRGVAVRDLTVSGSRIVAVRPVTNAKSTVRPANGLSSPVAQVGGYEAYEQALAERDARLATAAANAPAPGSMARDVVSTPVVRRGETVQATVVAGAVTVTTRGVAEADAALGQLVTIRSLDRKRTFAGVVVGPQSVRVGGER